MNIRLRHIGVIEIKGNAPPYTSPIRKPNEGLNRWIEKCKRAEKAYAAKYKPKPRKKRQVKGEAK